METRVIETCSTSPSAWAIALRVREALNQTAQAGCWSVGVEPHRTGRGMSYWVVIKTRQQKSRQRSGK